MSIQPARPLEREVLNPSFCLTSLQLPLDYYENDLQKDALNLLRPSRPRSSRIHTAVCWNSVLHSLGMENVHAGGVDRRRQAFVHGGQPGQRARGGCKSLFWVSQISKTKKRASLCSNSLGAGGPLGREVLVRTRGRRDALSFGETEPENGFLQEAEKSERLHAPIARQRRARRLSNLVHAPSRPFRS
jgi:hypothetical protein